MTSNARDHSPDAPRENELAPQLRVVDLGALSYADAYSRQLAEVRRVIEARALTPSSHHVGTLLLVEHPAVITISRRQGAAAHLKAAPEMLAREGVQVEETDRGGDITYHGPGQLVAYPILDLNRLRLRLHDYMRLLEEIVIEVCREVGVAAQRDPAATGVWVRSAVPDLPDAKICAMGVRIRQWVSMHGLAINVSTNLRHFDLIVPCGLADRRVTSLRELLGDRAPSIEQVKNLLTTEFQRMVASRLALPSENAASPPLTQA